MQNAVFLHGRLTRDPSVKEGSTTVARFTVAVDGRKKDGAKETDFVPCVAFGKVADTIKTYLKQGSEITVNNGRIKTGSYTNRDGQKVYTTDVIVNEFDFCGSKSSNNQGGEPAQKSTDDFVNVPTSANDSGLPFD